MSEILEQETNSDTNSKSITLTYGLITALALIVFSIISQLMNVEMQSWINYLVYVIYLVGVILACQAFSKSRDGNVTFGNVFGAGFKMVAFTTLIMVIWTVVSIYIFPEIKDRALEAAQTKMLEQGIDEDQMEMSLNMTRKSFTLFLTIGAIFNYLIAGIIFALIGAATAKKNKQPQPF